MDAVDIIILAAAGVGLVAFVVLALLILRQGRTIKELEDRIGPPVPPAAAPSLERVRALTTSTVASAPAPEVPEAPEAEQPQPGRPPTAREQARSSAEGTAAAGAADAEAGRTRSSSRGSSSTRSGARSGSSGRGALTGIAVVLALAILGVGGWWFFFRGDDSASTTAASTTQTTATTATTADTGEIPEDIPPVANKAAYTVAVLNASNVTGAAANKVAPRVQADGYTLGVVDNATSQDVTQSEVQYVKGRKEVAWNVAKDLGITKAVAINTLAEGRIGTADVVVVVGTDLAK